ncbi:hypothetical protein QTO34_008180 [Cnephaeus nilssonii]|uniref:Uncharacterized protein n=1 Tax=Cnephaeus nilssonii TaxID=3371016 RepID=A0AA40IA75_CNENI|nr:hypothetical protein QTO34_008180 [Eptesicus nilssonii]
MGPATPPPGCRSSRYPLECLGSQVSPPRAAISPGTAELRGLGAAILIFSTAGYATRSPAPQPPAGPIVGVAEPDFHEAKHNAATAAIHRADFPPTQTFTPLHLSYSVETTLRADAVFTEPNRFRQMAAFCMRLIWQGLWCLALPLEPPRKWLAKVSLAMCAGSMQLDV